MTELRRKHDGAYKARVTLEAIRGQKVVAELACEYGVHPNQITTRKKQFMEQLPGIFSKGSNNIEKSYEQEKRSLAEEDRSA